MLNIAPGLVPSKWFRYHRRTSLAPKETGDPVSERTGYQAQPTYPAATGSVARGWTSLARHTPASGVLAIDGPMVLDWMALIAGIRGLPRQLTGLDMRAAMVPWEQVLKRTSSALELVDDPDFATISATSVADLFDTLPTSDPASGTLTVVFGPGAALVQHDVLWYADLPKRFAEAETVAGTARNLGQPVGGKATIRRLFYIDWPMLDRHREAIGGDIDRWIDLQNPAEPSFIAGDDLRASLRWLSTRPFRTRPTFNSTPWGGHWAQERLGMNTDAPNTALGYELIAPESGILLGDSDQGVVEIPFQLLVAQHARALLGALTHQVFGTSFPVRFDYLDTFGGDSLSVHCHPQADYMRDVFGWPYTQDETYYVMVGSPDNLVYLGLRENVDVRAFESQARAAAEHGQAFDIFQFVQSHPADEHQLFLIPAGTPHGSGKDNVVLEISATPYLYSLRFYDWLRRSGSQQPRPVHVDHAFRNLDLSRCGAAVVDDLIQQPRMISSGPGWREEIIGDLPDMFFQVRRLELTPSSSIEQHTGGRFHILNVVAGHSVQIKSHTAAHPLHFAETIVIPASVGSYRLTSTSDETVRIVKAFVR